MSVSVSSSLCHRWFLCLGDQVRSLAEEFGALSTACGDPADRSVGFPGAITTRGHEENTPASSLGLVLYPRNRAVFPSATGC